jgi:hypothetical protein
MRTYTGKEVHGVVDEGRTGRIVARRVLRRGLGNPKRRLRDLQQFAFEMLSKGMMQGMEYMRGKIHNSVAGLDYGPGYYVQPEIMEGPVATDTQCSDPESDGPLSSSPAVVLSPEADIAIPTEQERTDEWAAAVAAKVSEK